MNPLETYLKDVQEVHSSGAGVDEISYYPALSSLLNEIGRSLKPKVRCVMNLKNLGAGMPDGGLFTADQFQRQGDSVPKAGQLPARGAIEVKGTKPEVGAIAASEQVKGYLKTYGIVIVCNLRHFLIVERGPNGQPVERESFALADDEKSFWRTAAAHPRATAAIQGEQFLEFIKRACLHAAPLTNPKDVAWFLASYARDALFRVEHRKELPALQTVRSALEEALGMKFTEEKGEHFFRSTLVQTLFYGVFSAWVRWHKDNPGPNAKFDWRTAEWSLHVPFIRTLYHQVADPNQLGKLGLVEVLDWAAGVLNRVDRSEFFKNFEDDHAVQYFYEPFLEAYDPVLRKALGVWYTPPEIVKYQVARVDTVLREELNLPDGLADPNVIVLDPCCGTGAYLVEVLNSIAATLREKGGDALVASDLKQAAMDRVFGFEILPAPFVVSHLQLGLKLQAQGAPLSHKKGERVGVYLTNSLTGWEPPKGPKQQVMAWADLQEERDAADHVKREKKILVVLGNPPYNAFAGVSPQEEQGLVEPYKVNLNKPISSGGWGIKKFNLDDLYVRFFRLAERRIAEMSGKGVVSFISNHSYLGDPSFVVMRQRFLAEFDKLWFDCMNGDSRETGKLTPEGKPDPSVFSTDYNREGIRVGTAVCVLVKHGHESPPRAAGSAPPRAAGSAPPRAAVPHSVAQPHDVAQPPSAGRWLPAPQQAKVCFRHFWGASKRADLLDSLNSEKFEAAYRLAAPCLENRFSFRPENVAAHYTQWPKIVELCEVVPSNGLMEKRGGALIDIDRDALEARMRDYFDAALSWDEYKGRQTALTKDAARCNAKDTRAKANAAELFHTERLRRYALRPFETRWCYYTPVRPVWNEPRPSLWRQCFNGNGFVMTRPGGVADPEGAPFSFTSCLGDNDYQRGHAYYFPLMINPAAGGKEGNGLFDSGKPHANLSKSTREYLSKLGIKDPDDVAQPLSAGLGLTPAAEGSAPPRAAVPHDRTPAKPGKSEYRRNLPHLQVEDKPIFLTFCTKNRWILPESVRSKVLAHCLHDHGRKIHVLGAVVMPDHIHMVFLPLHDLQGSSYTLAEITSGIKGASAHSINKALGRKGSMWQDESYDHVLRSDESEVEKVDYICANPVRKGLCRHETDYPWIWREWIEGRSASDEARSDTPEGGCATCQPYALIWMHALAIGYSPAYLSVNADGIRLDWPRIPLPDTRKTLEASAALGEQIAALLDTEADVPGVTCGKIAPLLKTIGLITKVGGGQLDTAGNDLAVTAGWGHFGKAGVVMPAKGKLAERQHDEKEAKAIDAEAASRGISPAEVRRLLGDNTLDVYINGTAFWRNIPRNVWDYYIGGYQVIKKWLSYREDEILGRALKPEEVREVTNMARRLAAIVLLQPALDANYQSVKAHTVSLPR